MDIFIVLINYSKINWNEVRMLQLTSLASGALWDTKMATVTRRQILQFEEMFWLQKVGIYLFSQIWISARDVEDFSDHIETIYKVFAWNMSAVAIFFFASLHRFESADST